MFRKFNESELSQIITDIQISVIWLVELTSRDIHYYSASASAIKKSYSPIQQL